MVRIILFISLFFIVQLGFAQTATEIVAKGNSFIEKADSLEQIHEKEKMEVLLLVKK